MDMTAGFEAERPRLVRIPGRVLGDPVEAEDVVQEAWLRLYATRTDIDNLGAWLTTVTTRLCLDRIRARTPVPAAEPAAEPAAGLSVAAVDPDDQVALADTVGIALQVVLDRLTPTERVAFVLHDSFGVEFVTIAEILGTSPVAARKLASRARSKVRQPTAQGHPPDWVVVDAFLAAARGGDLTRLLDLLAPDVVVEGDKAAVALGTPTRLAGRHDVAAFFNGAAKAALPVFVGDRPAVAWHHRGRAKVVFDLTIDAGLVRRIDFRADPAVLARVRTRRHDRPG